MDWQKGMVDALDYVENSLMDKVDLKIASKFVGCSTWEFQRLFSFMAHVSLGEYIRNRRLTLAAKEIQEEDCKIIDIALKYGYESPTAFSRAFSKLFGIAPSMLRKVGSSFNAYPRLTFEFIQKERFEKMSRFSERGYVVKENAPVYFTKDMDKTIKWFEEVLGWYGDIVTRDSSGNGEYGCVFDYPSEVAAAHITPFRGFHLFQGEPTKGVAGFLMIEGIEALHKHVKNNGWHQVSEINQQAWGAGECSITTLDGSILRCFESTR